MELPITFLLGIFIVIGTVTEQRAMNNKLKEQLSISIAFGTMEALIFLELIPEALENLPADKRFLFPFCLILGMIFLGV